MLSHDLARALLARRNNDIRIEVLLDRSTLDEEPTEFETQLISLRIDDNTLPQHLQDMDVLAYEKADYVVIRAGTVWAGEDTP